MNKVKGYRNMVKLTQDKMAELLGIRRETFQRKEARDSFTPSEKTKITMIFNEYGLELQEKDIF